ncbi:hypothetical protein F2Q70_00033735, partial [Brassica cretica]
MLPSIPPSKIEPGRISISRSITRIVKAEEWDSFIEILRKPLPAAFRVNSNGQFCDEILSMLENDFVKSLQAEAVESGEVEAIKPLPWYPNNLAWHSNFSRKEIRKNQTLERFHEFLKLETEVGNMTRQEAVSMVPPLFLDVHPDHFVLDMCAAPGSKTFQLLEIIHESAEPGSLPNGMVVANDVDYKRSNLLIHQTKRTCTTNLIVTNNEGQHFPNCNSIASEKCHHPIDQLLFDRVLCDVPCSGDGTLRKAPDIWRRWNSGSGNGLHSLQVVIAMRGLSLLKVGGRMEQRIVKAEEWDSFIEILRKPLPAAFRVNSNGQFCDEILSMLENDFVKSLQAEAVESGEVEAIKPLPWYPNNLAWHSNFSRKEIRKNQTLERFHEFLKLETEVGNMTRQEAVSMVPPLFLDVHPDHFVLDMCAAPGSKTFQLLEIIHESAEPGSLPNGMVVANDVDYKRSNLLIHQTKRTCTTNLIVTNNEGQHFPNCNSIASEKCHHPIDQLLFDRVLCDVPCSGDGTLRKAPDIWRRWNSGSGNGLHSLQVVIAMR